MKLALSDISNLQNESSVVATLAANNNATEIALENTLSRDGTSPNTLLADIDMNSHTLLNLADPVSNQEPVTKSYGDAHYGDSLASATAAATSAADAAADAVATAADRVAVAADAATVSADKTTTLGYSTAAATSAANAATSETNAANSAGVIGAKWAFETSTTMAAPATGGLRFNDATVASVSAIAINAQDVELGNPNLRTYVTTWDDSTNTVKGYLVFRKLGTPSTYAIFSVSAVTDNTTWLQIAVTHVSSSGTWSAADTLVAGFTRAGDKGLDGSLTGPVASVDNELALWSGTSGTTLKRATTTGLLKGTSGVIGAATAGTDYLAPPSGSSILKANAGGALANAVAGTDYQAADAQLSSNIPQNSKSAAYTTVLTDGEKHILHPSADTTARTFTIDSNANVAYPIGTAITFVNQNSAGVVTIAITSDTMRLAGAGTTGSRTLAANGIATALKITATEWIISGVGLT